MLVHQVSLIFWTKQIFYALTTNSYCTTFWSNLEILCSIKSFKCTYQFLPKFPLFSPRWLVSFETFLWLMWFKSYKIGFLWQTQLTASSSDLLQTYLFDPFHGACWILCQKLMSPTSSEHIFFKNGRFFIKFAPSLSIKDVTSFLILCKH